MRCLALVSLLCAVACTKSAQPGSDDTRGAADVAHSPGAPAETGPSASRPAPESTKEEPTVKEKLAEIVHKAAADPRSYSDLELSYYRGHELAGTTQFKVKASGAYTLESNVTKGRRQVSLSGTLEPDAVTALLGEAAAIELVDIASSTRNIGDDEEPVIVELTYQTMSHKLMLWARDAKEHEAFHGFEVKLLELVEQVSDGEVLTTAY